MTKLEQWIIEARRHAMVANEQAATEQVTPKDGTKTQQGESATEDVDPDDSASAVLEEYRSFTAQSVHSRHSNVSKASAHASSLRRKEEVNVQPYSHAQPRLLRNRHCSWKRLNWKHSCSWKRHSSKSRRFS